MNLFLCALLFLAVSTQQATLQCNSTSPAITCATFTYLNSEDDINDLCKQMDFMPGCAIRKACTTSSSTSGFCSPFSILGDICSTDMTKMRSCSQYASLCGVAGPGDMDIPIKPTTLFKTNITQCSENPPIPRLPATKTASARISSICSEMNMVAFHFYHTNSTPVF